MIAKKAFPGLSLPWQWAVGTGAVIALAVFWHPLARLLGQVGVAVLLAGGALPICRRIEKRLPRPWAAALSILAIIFSRHLSLLLDRQGRQAPLHIRTDPGRTAGERSGN